MSCDPVVSPEGTPGRLQAVIYNKTQKAFDFLSSIKYLSNVLN